LQAFLDPFYRTYRCGDGRLFYVVAASHTQHPRRALQALGLEILLAELPDFDVYTDSKDWPAPWALRSYPVGTADRARITRSIEAAFLTRPASEWEAIFGKALAPATRHQTTKEWLADTHALAAGLILEVDDPRHGKMRQMGNCAWLGGDEGALVGQVVQRRQVGLAHAGVDPLDLLAEALSHPDPFGGRGTLVHGGGREDEHCDRGGGRHQA